MMGILIESSAKSGQGLCLMNVPPWGENMLELLLFSVVLWCCRILESCVMVIFVMALFLVIHRS